MILKSFAVTSILILAATQAQAALAPNYQRAKEMTAVIDAVAEQMPNDPIIKVIYQKPDQYQVVTRRCSAKALIISKPQQKMMVGPRAFEVKVLSRRCGK